jgi:hypothetical protein
MIWLLTKRHAAVGDRCMAHAKPSEGVGEVDVLDRPEQDAVSGRGADRAGRKATSSHRDRLVRAHIVALCRQLLDPRHVLYGIAVRHSAIARISADPT